MKIINEEAVVDILKNLTRGECLELLKELHSALSKCSVETHNLSKDPSYKQTIYQPLRTNITTSNNDITLVMPASNTEITSVKVLTAPHTGNLTAMMSFVNSEGTPLGIISGTSLTPFRTALAVMIVFMKYLGRKQTILIFGAGRQAEWHVRLAALLHDPAEITKIIVIARNGEKAMELVSKLKPDYKHTQLEGRAMSSVDTRLLHTADAIFTCTPSKSPLFPYKYLDPKRQYFFSLIGSYVPDMHEIDQETLMSALPSSSGSKIYVDSREACLEESGELIDAQIRPDQLIEIGELALEDKIDVPESGNVLLKAVGMGIMDLTVGKALLDLATRTNRCVNVDW